MRRQAVAALLLLGCGWAATLWIEPWSDARVNDLFVFRSFADPVLHGELPYRDVFLEYPPLAAPAIALPGLLGTGEEAFRLAFAGWTLLLAAAVVLMCGALAARTGGDRRRALMAAALAPLLLGAVVRTHFDLAPVALVLAGLLLLVVDRPCAGLAVLGLGVMTKGFPLVVAPVALAWLAAGGRRREALWGAGALLAVMGAVGLGAYAVSPDGALEAVRYQVDRPVQVESVPASLLLALDGLGAGEARSVASHRSDGVLHVADDAVATTFLVLLGGALGWLATRAARHPRDRRGLVLSSLTAIAAFATLGPVLSPQFLIWLLPLAALALAWRMHLLAFAVATAALLTQVEFPAHYFEVVAREPQALAVLGLRNAVLLAALALALLQLGRQEQLLDRRRALLAVRLD